MRILIVVNGGRESPAEIVRWHEGCDKLIAVDGGAELVAQADLAPDIVIGDFDSISPERLAQINPHALIHNPDQNTTDFQKALTHATSLGAVNIVVLDPEGDRLDHALSALGWASQQLKGRKIRFVFSRAIVHLLDSEAEYECREGSTISILPLESSQIIRTSGLKWNIQNTKMKLGEFDSVSNLAESERIAIHVASGVVAVFIDRFDGDVHW